MSNELLCLDILLQGILVHLCLLEGSHLVRMRKILLVLVLGHENRLIHWWLRIIHVKLRLSQGLLIKSLSELDREKCWNIGMI